MKTLHSICSVLLAASTVLAVTGCAQLGKDPRDAHWDPKPPYTLLDVTPNWDRKAVIQCGHHLREKDRRPGMTDRC
jgi:hypothetical protein